MSSWDEQVFTGEDNVDFLDDLVDLDETDLHEALEDAITIALKQASRGDVDYAQGLCAASIAAVWCGAPFSSTAVTEAHPFVREYIGDCPETLQQAAFQLLEAEFEAQGEDNLVEGLETYVEAVS
ncbi:DUF4259 domain-containing protein [Corynebacterium heidelbergense]|uniref:DUF4259 domain-containing protein n=1 Tax=Corynebacterium heidelbergense TaxID=2055947 RepID=A0A364VA20_9CORY|nr:DUF4259 domain-containing protein [Corynebacterium heidelbergense]RAV33510.1 hypothetical protein CWC39_08135 [Corynebacterium heidelbergense]WCZ37189.1 hypothetical protein CHEID_08295 [Corynebacterium heidelbergense]